MHFKVDLSRKVWPQTIKLQPLYFSNIYLCFCIILSPSSELKLLMWGIILSQAKCGKFRGAQQNFENYMGPCKKDHILQTEWLCGQTYLVTSTLNWNDFKSSYLSTCQHYKWWNSEKESKWAPILGSALIGPNRSPRADNYILQYRSQSPRTL